MDYIVDRRAEKPDTNKESGRITVVHDAVALDKNGNLNVNRMEYLKKHNIVYCTPEYKGYNGFCIGNGKFGGMLFHS